MAYTVDITGLAELGVALKKLPGRAETRVLRAALKAALQPLAQETRARCPVGRNIPKRNHTRGALRRAIEIKETRKRKGWRGTAVQIGERDFVGDFFYGAMVELGTVKMRPRQFMRQAFEATVAVVEAIARREILRGIEREAEKLYKAERRAARKALRQGTAIPESTIS